MASAFWRKFLGTIGIAVVETYLDKHPAAMSIILSGETTIAELRRALRETNLIAAASHIDELSALWGQLVAELKKS